MGNMGLSNCGAVYLVMLSVSIVLLIRSVPDVILRYNAKKVSGVSLSWTLYLVLTHIALYRSMMLGFTEGTCSFDRELIFFPAMFLLIITSTILNSVDPMENNGPEKGFLKRKKLFFPFYISYHLWLLVVGKVVPTYDPVVLANLLSAGLAVYLWAGKNYRWQISGNVAAWLISIYSFAVQLINK